MPSVFFVNRQSNISIHFTHERGYVGTYPRERREAGGSREKNKREEQKRRTKETEGGAEKSKRKKFQIPVGMKQGRGSRGPTEARPGERESKRKKINKREREGGEARGINNQRGRRKRKDRGHTRESARQAAAEKRTKEKSKREEQKRERAGLVQKKVAMKGIEPATFI